MSLIKNENFLENLDNIICERPPNENFKAQMMKPKFQSKKIL